MTLDKENSYIELFMGTKYKLDREIKTVGQLKSWLEEIIQDLPADNDEKIAEVYLLNDELAYLLEEGISR